MVIGQRYSTKAERSLDLEKWVSKKGLGASRGQNCSLGTKKLRQDFCVQFLLCQRQHIVFIAQIAQHFGFVAVALQYPLNIHLLTSCVRFGSAEISCKPRLKLQDLAEDAMEMSVVIFAGLLQLAHRENFAIKGN